MVSHPCVQTFTARTARKDELNSRDAIINGQWCVFLEVKCIITITIKIEDLHILV